MDAGGLSQPSLLLSIAIHFDQPCPLEITFIYFFIVFPNSIVLANVITAWIMLTGKMLGMNEVLYLDITLKSQGEGQGG